MPILGAFPVLESIEPPKDERAESRSLAFRALDGTYPFPATGRECFFMPDLDGLDLPPVELITKQVPGMDGERLKEIRTGRREVFLPLWMSSDSTHQQYLERRDLLAALFDHHAVDYVTEEGTFDLVAFSERGERYLRCTYSDGMRSVKRPNEGATWAKLGITAVAVQPFWSGERWQTPVIRKPAGVSFFGAFPPRLSSSRALGADIPIQVQGDVPSWVTVDLVGPADSVTIEGAVTVSIPDGLGPGEPARIVTDPRGRTALFDGVQQWDRVGPVTTWRPLSPGRQLLTIAIEGAEPDSSAVVSGPTLYKRPW